MRFQKHYACKSHCCVDHGCKYGYPDCPVVLKSVIQDHHCQDCADNSDFDVQKLLRDQIRQSLPIAVYDDPNFNVDDFSDRLSTILRFKWPDCYLIFRDDNKGIKCCLIRQGKKHYDVMGTYTKEQYGPIEYNTTICGAFVAMLKVLMESYPKVGFGAFLEEIFSAASHSTERNKSHG